MASNVWRKQPPGPAPLNWGAAINRELAFATPLGPGDGMRDLVRSVEGTRTGLGTRGIAQSGSYPIFGSSDYLSFPALDGISGTTPITIAWTQQVTSVVNGFPNVIGWRPTGATSRFLIICGPSAGYYFCAGPQNGASNTAAWNGAIGASAVGRHNNFVLQIKAGTDSADRTTFELFSDGVKITRDALPTSFGVNTTSEFLIGTRSGGDGFQGHIGNLHIWRRVLTDSEARDWTQNPFITRQALTRGRRDAVVAGGASGPTGLATETDLSQALGVARPAGQANETDSALNLAGAQLRATGFAVETDSAQTLARLQLRATGMAAETDIALALAGQVGSGVGVATETDSALTLAAARPAGVATEADSAQTLGGLQLRAAGLATEVDSALARAALQILHTGLAAEIDAAFALNAAGPLSVGLAQETDTALALASGSVVESIGNYGTVAAGPFAPRRFGQRRRLAWSAEPRTERRTSAVVTEVATPALDATFATRHPAAFADAAPLVETRANMATAYMQALFEEWLAGQSAALRADPTREAITQAARAKPPALIRSRPPMKRG